MFNLTATGYVTGEVKIEDGEYGKRGILTIRARTATGKQTHFINATFYGKKIDVVQKYMEDGRQVAVSGVVKNMMGKKSKNGDDYCSIYMDCTDFSLPERQNESSGSRGNSKQSDVDF